MYPCPYTKIPTSYIIIITHKFITLRIKEIISLMQNKQSVLQRKICLLGDFGVGKTSLVRRFVEGRFDDQYLSSIGVKISRYALKGEKERPINLIIWDLAGNEEFNGKHKSYLQGSFAALLVCDLTRNTTLPSLRTYINRMRAVEPNARFTLVANKSDLKDDLEITEEDIAIFANEYQIKSFITSAKDGDFVEEAFKSLVISE